MTFSCSSHFGGWQFTRAIQHGQKQAQRNFRLLERLGPACDHPFLLGHPEGEYLTGLWLTELG